MNNEPEERTIWDKTKEFISENKFLCIVLGILLFAVMIIILILVLSHKSKNKEKETFEGTDLYSDGYSYVKSYLSSTLGEDNLV